ncbi:hypothetical protein D3C72_1895840 [compost metagenome]
MMNRAVAGDIRLGQADHLVEIAQADRFQVIQAADRASALEHVSGHAERLPIGSRQRSGEMSAG